MKKFRSIDYALIQRLEWLSEKEVYRGNRAILKRKRFLAPFFFFGILILFDQGTKSMALWYFPQRVICNTVGPWNLPIPIPILIIASVSVLFLVLVGIVWEQERCSFASLFIVAGGFGNLLDRVLRQCVVDFLSLPILPVFNVADLFLSVGVIWFGVLAWKESRNAFRTVHSKDKGDN